MQRGIIRTTESGVDLVVELKIKNFFKLPETDGACYISHDFSFGGERWYLLIYPNGWCGSDSSGHVDLELCKWSSDRPIRQSFSLSLKTANGEKYNEQHCSKDFDNRKYFHRFNRLVPRSELSRRRSDLAPDGTLTVICTMKSSTSAARASDTRNDHEHAYVGAFTQRVRASTQRLGASTQRVGASTHLLRASTQRVRASMQRVRASMQRVRASTQRVRASTQRVRASTQRVRASTQRLGASTQRLGASTQRLGASNQRLGASTQRVGASTQTVVSTQTLEEKYEAAAPGSATNSQEIKALHDFKELFLKKEDCDVTIKVKSSEFLAHRVILKARSPVFASTFRHDMTESATGVLEIDDCDPPSFSDFLCFLYCADVQLIIQKRVFDLFTLADKYQVLDLRSKCLEFMKNNLTVGTFCETITLALRHSETDLIKLSTDYFTKNAPKIIMTVKWQTFLAENPTESNELCIKMLVPNRS